MHPWPPHSSLAVCTLLQLASVHLCTQHCLFLLQQFNCICPVSWVFTSLALFSIPLGIRRSHLLFHIQWGERSKQYTFSTSLARVLPSAVFWASSLWNSLTDGRKMMLPVLHEHTQRYWNSFVSCSSVMFTDSGNDQNDGWFLALFHIQWKGIRLMKDVSPSRPWWGQSPEAVLWDCHN